MTHKVDREMYVKLGQELREARENKGYSLDFVAEKVGLSKKTIQRYEIAESRISINVLYDICKVLDIEPVTLTSFFDVNLNFEQNPEANFNYDHYEKIDLPKIDENKQQILQTFKLFENPVSAGRGTWLDEGTEYNYIEIEHPPVSADFALRVRGDSMSPKYNDGDVVFVKSRTLLEPGQVGVFLINGEGYLKQWQGNMLLSLNREYDPIYVEENDEFLIVGKVVEKLSE